MNDLARFDEVMVTYYLSLIAGSTVRSQHEAEAAARTCMQKNGSAMSV
jgi:hypothetical protein